MKKPIKLPLILAIAILLAAESSHPEICMTGANAQGYCGQNQQENCQATQDGAGWCIPSYHCAVTTTQRRVSPKDLTCNWNGNPNFECCLDHCSDCCTKLKNFRCDTVIAGQCSIGVVTNSRRACDPPVLLGPEVTVGGRQITVPCT